MGSAGWLEGSFVVAIRGYAAVLAFLGSDNARTAYLVLKCFWADDRNVSLLPWDEDLEFARRVEATDGALLILTIVVSFDI